MYEQDAAQKPIPYISKKKSMGNPSEPHKCGSGSSFKEQAFAPRLLPLPRAVMNSHLPV